MHPQFELASGSVIGRDHRVAFRNCQDSLHIVRCQQRLVAVVADGCGSAPHSEIGAQLGSRLLANIVLSQTDDNASAIKWPRVLRHLQSDFDGMARRLSDRDGYRKTVEDYFLCTFLGVVIDHDVAVFFGLGDGTLVINGEYRQLGPYPGNKPPYAAYGLIADEIVLDPSAVSIWTEAMPLSKLHHFLIGTDGVGDVIDAAGRKMPGLERQIEGLEQFWLRDRYFGANPDLVSRQLRLYGRDWPKSNPEIGILPDDTTLIVGRRTHLDQA